MAAVSAGTNVDSGHATLQNTALVNDSVAPKRVGQLMTTESHVSTPSHSNSTTSSPDVGAARRRKPVLPRRLNASEAILVTNGSDDEGNAGGPVSINKRDSDAVRTRRASEHSVTKSSDGMKNAGRKRNNRDSASDDGGESPARKLGRRASTTIEPESTGSDAAAKVSPTDSVVRNGESSTGANAESHANANTRNGDDSALSVGTSRRCSENESKVVNLRPAANGAGKLIDTYDEALHSDTFFWLDSHEWLSRSSRTRPYAPTALPHFLFEYLRKIQRQPPELTTDASLQRKTGKVYLYRCSECGDTFVSESSLRMHRARRTNLIFYDCPFTECGVESATGTKTQESDPIPNGTTETDTTKPKKSSETDAKSSTEKKKGRLRFYNRCALLSHVRRHGALQIDAKRVSVAAIPFEYWRADYLLGLVGTTATDPARMSELESLFAPSASWSTDQTAASAFVPTMLPVDTAPPLYAQSLNPLRIAPIAANGDTLFEQADASSSGSLRSRLTSRNEEVRRRGPGRMSLSAGATRSEAADEDVAADKDSSSNLRIRKRAVRNRQPHANEDGARQRAPHDNSAQRDRSAPAQTQQEPISIDDDDNSYACQSCQMSFPSREKLGSHLNSMRSSPSVSCPLCQLPCATDCQYDAHMRLHRAIWGVNPQWTALAGASNTHHEDRDTVMCPECGLMLPTNDIHELRAHIRVACCHFQRTLMFVCSKCQRAFYNLTQLREHLLRLHATNGLACPVQSCPLVFSTFEDLAAHASRKHTGISLDLEACAARAAQSGGANSRTKCPICADLFPVTPAGRAAFERHVDVVHLKANSTDIQTFVYRCIHCLQLFSGARVLGPHLGRQHRDAALIRNPNEPPASRIACLFCAESFSSMREALLHEQCDHIQAVASKPTASIHTGAQRNL